MTFHCLPRREPLPAMVVHGWFGFGPGGLLLDG